MNSAGIDIKLFKSMAFIFVEHIADGAHVLDVGCGYGAVARSIARARPNTHVVGVDYDKRRLAQARASDNPVNLSFVETDATKSLKNTENRRFVESRRHFLIIFYMQPEFWPSAA